MNELILWNSLWKVSEKSLKYLENSCYQSTCYLLTILLRGPIDDGKKVDGPGLLVRTAFKEGVK